MRRRGRPLALRGVLPFDDPTVLALMPQELVVDTSFVAEALIASQPRHLGAREFLRQIGSAGTTVYFNRLLELELAETAFRLALKERHPKRWQRARHDGRSRQRGRRLLDQATTAWSDVLDNISWACVEVEEVIDRVPALMSDYGLSSYDAVHAATAILLAVPEFATMDAGFAPVPEDLLILHVDRARVRRCREIRARA